MTTYRTRQTGFGLRKYIVTNAAGDRLIRPDRLTRQEAQSILDQLTAGTLEPTVCPYTEDEDEADHKAAAAMEKGFDQQRGNMHRSRIGGGFDTQLWD